MPIWCEFCLAERDLESGKHVVTCEMCSEDGYEEIEGEVGKESLEGWMNRSR